MSIAVYRNGSAALVEDPASVAAFVAGLPGGMALRGPLRPTLVFFGGFKGSRPRGGPGVSRAESRDDGSPGKTPSFRALSAVRQHFPPPGRVLAYDPVRAPAEESSAVLRTALSEFCGSCGDFDPRAPLVVYGYSSGGYNALAFCLRLEAHYGWYSFRRQRLGDLNRSPGADDCREGAALRVDLLVTVDASIRSWEGWRRNQVSMPLPEAPRPLVKRHLNYFQTSDEEFHGYQMSSADNERQAIPGRVSHRGIPNDDAVASGVRGAVQELLRGFGLARAA